MRFCRRALAPQGLRGPGPARSSKGGACLHREQGALAEKVGCPGAGTPAAHRGSAGRRPFSVSAAGAGGAAWVLRRGGRRRGCAHEPRAHGVHVQVSSLTRHGGPWSGAAHSPLPLHPHARTNHAQPRRPGGLGTPQRARRRRRRRRRRRGRGGDSVVRGRKSLPKSSPAPTHPRRPRPRPREQSRTTRGAPHGHRGTARRYARGLGWSVLTFCSGLAGSTFSATDSPVVFFTHATIVQMQLQFNQFAMHAPAPSRRWRTAAANHSNSKMGRSTPPSCRPRRRQTTSRWVGRCVLVQFSLRPTIAFELWRAAV